eukprot:Partr_v1_DN25684_c1_g1_i5_m4873 putative B double prime 1, subunit of RNA polymerase III transcription initiation factor IIIB
MYFNPTRTQKWRELTDEQLKILTATIETPIGNQKTSEMPRVKNPKLAGSSSPKSIVRSFPTPPSPSRRSRRVTSLRSSSSLSNSALDFFKSDDDEEFLDELPRVKSSDIIKKSTDDLKSEGDIEKDEGPIDTSKMTMADLCRAEKRDPSKSAKGKKASKTTGSTSTPNDENDEPLSTAESTQKSAAAPTSLKSSYRGPKVRIVDGQITIDEESMEVSQDKPGGRDLSELEQIEENHATRHITSASFSRHAGKKSPKWTLDDTEKFYEGLKIWGTDFEFISRMFENRTRRHVKLKYNHEEKVNPARIDLVLNGPGHRSSNSASTSAVMDSSSQAGVVQGSPTRGVPSQPSCS